MNGCCFFCVVSAAVTLMATSCGGAVDGSAPVVFGDLELLSKARTLVFSFAKTQTCANLVDLSPVEIGTLLENAQENAPLQLLDATATEHVFGKVDPNTATAYFVLASTRADFGKRVAFSDLSGTVFAMGCRDFSAAAGTRQDLAISLFPIGLR